MAKGLFATRAAIPACGTGILARASVARTVVSVPSSAGTPTLLRGAGILPVHRRRGRRRYCVARTVVPVRPMHPAPATRTGRYPCG
ncbi:MAG: hypothetical protein NZ874_07450 [Fimbriimonadales bacterium]|nr:hypothetical protein [Fimbriimonadales bacterium]